MGFGLHMYLTMIFNSVNTNSTCIYDGYYTQKHRIPKAILSTA